VRHGRRSQGTLLLTKQYFPDERKLRDEPDADHPNRPKIIRSDYLGQNSGT
jgi:hypothetical protein